MGLRSFIKKTETSKGTVIDKFYAPNFEEALIGGTPQLVLSNFEVPHYEVKVGNSVKTIISNDKFEEGEEVLVDTERYFNLFEFNTLKKKN